MYAETKIEILHDPQSDMSTNTTIYLILYTIESESSNPIANLMLSYPCSAFLID